MILIISKKKLLSIPIAFLAISVLLSFLYFPQNLISAGTTNKELRTIVLDAGHGGEDPGAVSDYSGLKEKDVNLIVATSVKQMLEAENYKVIMTRSEDRLEYTPDTTNVVKKRKQDLIRRKKIMDEGGGDVVVSIHLNKFPQDKYSGAQVFFPPASAPSQKLAQEIQKSIRTMVSPDNNREALVKKEPIIILKDYKTPTVIVECGFLSNMEEEKKLGEEGYQKKIAVAIKSGINEYFKK